MIILVFLSLAALIGLMLLASLVALWMLVKSNRPSDEKARDHHTAPLGNPAHHQQLRGIERG